MILTLFALIHHIHTSALKSLNPDTFEHLTTFLDEESVLTLCQTTDLMLISS